VGVVDAALAEPVNGIVELAGPERIRMDELIRRFLQANQDERQVITDEQARYYGLKVNDQSLTPGQQPRLGPTSFDTWLRSQPQSLALAH
jgi:hypothetical protein